MSEENIVEVGHVVSYSVRCGCAIVELTAPLAVGDLIIVKGPATNFEQVVESIQIGSQNVQRAEAGQSIGLKITQRMGAYDRMYKKL